MRTNKILQPIYRKSVTILLKLGFGKYQSLHKISRTLRFHLRSDYAMVDGHKMFLDPLDSLELSTTGKFEEFETQIVKKIIHEGSTVIDMGANIGYYTLIFARLVGSEGKVFAFEPDPENFHILKKNLEINNYQNVILEQKAVSNQSGKLRLYLDNKNKGAHTIFKPVDNAPSVEINAITLDDYFRNFKGKIDFIKMDIEGGEAEAVEGMSSILNKDDIIIMTEFNPSVLKKIGKESLVCINLLKRYDFDIYHIDSKNKKLVPIDFKEFLQIYNPESKHFTNLLCIKGRFDITKLDNW